MFTNAQDVAVTITASLIFEAFVNLLSLSLLGIHDLMDAFRLSLKF
jgi:hypothetical protein